MKKAFLFALFIFNLISSVDAQNNPVMDCPEMDCNRGNFNPQTCQCDCKTGFIGVVCDSVAYETCHNIEANVRLIDFVETADPADIVEIDGVKWLKKNTNPYREISIKNIGDKTTRVISPKSNTGAIVPVYKYLDDIQPGEETIIKVRYDTKRVGEKLNWITVATKECTIRIPVFTRIIDQ